MGLNGRTDSPCWALLAGSIFLSLGFIAGLTGCGKAPVGETDAVAAGETAAAPQQPPVRPTTARGILQQMVAAYRGTPGYADKGMLRLQAREGDQKVAQEANYSVVFARPNRLRMQVYEAVLVSNGEEMSAYANNVANQVVRRKAPTTFDVKALFQDEMLAGALSGAVSQAPTQGFSWVPLQMLLLAAQDPLKTLLHRSAEPVLLEPAKIDELPCDRVELVRPDGKAVLWIDQKTRLLRRVQLPVEEMLKSLPPDQKVTDLSLTVDFVGARFEEQIDDSAFEFEIPKEAKTLETLTPPSLMLLGNPAPEFAFKDLDGKTIDPASLKGKVVVLDFWATWCDPCRVKFPYVEKVYQKYKGNDKVAFVGVSVDLDKTPDKDLKAWFADLGLSLPMARDPKQDAGKLFFIVGIPATCILDPKGIVQDFQMGFRPTHEADLAAKIDKLLAGKDIHEEPLRVLADERKQYLAWVDKWVKDELFIAPASDEQQELPKTAIASRSEPKTFARELLWKSTDLKSPGNVAVAVVGGQPRFYVIDSWKNVVEIGADGKTLATHSLELGEREAATAIRINTIGEKRYFLLFAAMQQQVHVFDDNWKRVLSYPESAPANPHAGIADAVFADLDADGKPEIYVAYFGEVGVQRADFDGKRVWSNRSLSMVSRLAVGPKNADGQAPLLCTNSLGSIIALDSQGKRLDEHRVPNRLIHWIAAAGDKTTEIAGLSLAELGQSVAVGIGPKGEERWSYPLPKGIHQLPIEQILPGPRAATGPTWIFPGADGSIHFVSADGRAIDQFNYGEPLAGMAWVEGEPAVLVVATPKGVEAWRISKAAAAP